LILYNGQTGSLGRYFADAVPANSDKLVALKARLEDRAALRAELMQLQVSRGEEVSLVQMAARVSVPACEADPEGTHKTNVMDTMATVSDFLDWAKLKGVEARVLFVSTGHVYAASSEALTEESPLGPRSVYAKSKLAAENALRGICDKRASLIIARVFGLVAPEQPGHYVLARTHASSTRKRSDWCTWTRLHSRLYRCARCLSDTRTIDSDGAVV
jgi:nucleoside-diphosphate-sugar epimerase